MKYTVKDLMSDFPDDDACLQWLVEYLYPEGVTCKSCAKITKHYKVTGRPAYACSACGRHMNPMAGTIFHRSRTPLTLWFHAIYLMSSNKAGTSAKQIERELGVTYKTAWRMMHQIRSMMGSDEELQGEVEVDETYVHPNCFKRSSAKRRYGRTGCRTGQILFGVVERGGTARIWHVRTAGERVLVPLIRKNVRRGTLVHSDGARAYDKLDLWGYPHRTTNHGAWEFYREDSYTQNIENVWSHLKRGIKGVYRYVSPKYLQLYANEYAWRYSNRKRVSMFWALMCRIR